MERKHTIYLLRSPSGRCYIGQTSTSTNRRWRSHVQRARKGGKHPLHSAIRRYGDEAFEVVTLQEGLDTTEVDAAESAAIEDYKALTHGYNLSPGGGIGDSLTGVAQLALLREDPEWDTAYRAALSRGCMESPHHRARATEMAKQALAWRAENPREAYYLSRRNARCAQRKNRESPQMGPREPLTEAQREKVGAGVRFAFQQWTPAKWKRKSMTSRQAATEVWAGRDESERQAIGDKISGAHKTRYGRMTPEEKAKHDAQLAEARKSIDHEVRKARQREAVSKPWTPERYAKQQAYWTPERRAAQGAKIRARNAAKKREKSADSTDV